jgi:integrase/recombinase XerD
MKLSHTIFQYVDRKQSTGMRFHESARILKCFCRSVGDIPLAKVTEDAVRVFLNGAGPPTAIWRNKYGVLAGFYRYAIARGYVASSPLPRDVPKLPQDFVPYVYTRDELRRLLAAIPQNQKYKWCAMEAHTLRALILLLYGSGLRISEALSLRVVDADLNARLLTIRETKFYKTRLVPVGPKLAGVLRRYLAQQRRNQHIQGEQAHFFTTKRGEPIKTPTVQKSFQRLRQLAGVERHDGSRYQPRLHDLRHSFAVHRLTAWYREGADVQRLLPQLSTYLGHGSLVGTQRYLTMTPELLGEASDLFERYAMREVIHE